MSIHLRSNVVDTISKPVFPETRNCGGPVHRVALIQSEGSGLDAVLATAQVIEATGVPIKWDHIYVNVTEFAESHGRLSQSVLNSIRRVDAVLKGPEPNSPDGLTPTITDLLRNKLQLFATSFLVRKLPGSNPHIWDADVDVVIFQENGRTLNPVLKLKEMPGLHEVERVIARRDFFRVAQSAFSFARREGRRSLKVVHKAKIIEFGNGLFLDVCRQVAKDYPEIETGELVVEAAVTSLLQRPQTLDVLLTPVLYGGILSSLALQLARGPRAVPVVHLGERYAVFETFDAFTDRSDGRDRANPVALMLSAVHLLKHLGEKTAAERLESAIRTVCGEGGFPTPDLSGSASLSEFTESVVRELR